MKPVLRQIIEILYGLTCFFIYASGMFQVVTFLKRKRPVILFYHSINQRDCPDIYPDCIISVENFQKQMDWLSRKRNIVSLSEIISIIKNNTEIPPNTVVLTFDDGYYDFYSQAYPILKKFKFPATLFPITNLLNSGEGKWEDELTYLVNMTNSKSFKLDVKGRNMHFNISSMTQKINTIRELNSILCNMNDTDRINIINKIKKAIGTVQGFRQITVGWNELRDLKNDPLITFGAHTHNHVNLGTVNYEIALFEIINSKKEIEKVTEKECNLFSYPIGKTKNITQETKKILKDNSFLGAVTTIPGGINRKSDLLELKRIAAINGASYKFKCSLIGFALQRS